MAFVNNVMIVRRFLLERLVKMWKEGILADQIDRLPLEFSPKYSSVRGRCCIHKERAVWKYKSLPLMGFDMDDETDELTPLSAYAKKVEKDEISPKENVLCVIDEACSSCVQINYEITNLCRGCVARTCYMNCPKDAIEFTSQGKAQINHHKCISCGICANNCPFHAIVYIPIPCEEACPVKAITRNENGVEQIDESKCIYCGKCINACPFGAIFEVSQAFPVLNSIKKGEEVIAIVAPSILSQYEFSIEKVYGAIKAIGFKDVIEVAQGAMHTTENEAKELLEKLETGQSFMTTSCCPSYVALVNKHIPQLKPYISHTPSPMAFAARIAKEKYPQAKVVFIGPCTAKIAEGRRDPNVDYVLTFEETQSVMDGLGIDMDKVEPFVVSFESDKPSHGYAAAGGVLSAVCKKVPPHSIKGGNMSNINKKNIALLRSYGKTGNCPYQFMEVMACEGGCISGPSLQNDIRSAARLYDKEMCKR